MIPNQLSKMANQWASKRVAKWTTSTHLGVNLQNSLARSRQGGQGGILLVLGLGPAFTYYLMWLSLDLDEMC